MLFHTTRHYYWTVFIYWDELLNVLNAELKKAKRLHGSTNKSSWPRLNLLEERWPGWLRAATSTSAVEEWNIHTCWQRPTCRALLQEKQTWHWFPLRRQTWWDTRGCDGVPSPEGSYQLKRTVGSDPKLHDTNRCVMVSPLHQIFCLSCASF